MRRTTLLALFATLLLAPTTAWAGASPTTILRDCADDGVLQGNYSTAELRNAQNHIPTDIDEYSDCRDVLSRALQAGTTSHDSSGGGGGGTTGSTGGGGSTSSGAASTPTPSATPAQGSLPDSANLSDTSGAANKLPAPYSLQDHQAVDAADGAGADELKHSSVPSARLEANIGRNTVPGLLVGVLALLVAASLALLVKPLRRVIGHG